MLYKHKICDGGWKADKKKMVMLLAKGTHMYANFSVQIIWWYVFL